MNIPKSALVAIVSVVSAGVVFAPRTCHGEGPSGSVNAILLQVNRLHDQGEVSQAIPILDAAIDKYGPIGKLFVARGLSKLSAKRFEDAIEDFSRAISLEFKVANALVYRGVCRQAIGERDLALGDFNRAIEVNPNLEEAYLMRGRFYFLGGQIQAAVKDYSTAIETSPSAGAYIGRACCYLEMEEWEALAADATDAARLDPDHLLPIQMRMLANAKLGRSDAALEDYRIAKQLEAKSGE